MSSYFISFLSFFLIKEYIRIFSSTIHERKHARSLQSLKATITNLHSRSKYGGSGWTPNCQNSREIQSKAKTWKTLKNLPYHVKIGTASLISFILDTCFAERGEVN